MSFINMKNINKHNHAIEKCLNFSLNPSFKIVFCVPEWNYFSHD